MAAGALYEQQAGTCEMSANLVATSNGALDMLANGTGSVNGSVNGIINQPIDQFAHNGRIVEEEAEDGEEPREIDINLQNVVCTFRTGCHLNLRTIATNGANVQYNRARSVSYSCFQPARDWSSINLNM